MVRQSIRNAINRSLDIGPKYNDLSDTNTNSNSKSKKVNYKCLKGSPKMKYKSLKQSINHHHRAYTYLTFEYLNYEHFSPYHDIYKHSAYFYLRFLLFY